MKFFWITFFVFCAWTTNGHAQVPSATVPEFSFYRFDKTVFTQHDLPHGKMIFFIFFDVTCAHCQRAMKNIAGQYASFRNAAIYLISLDDQQKIDQFLATYGNGLRSKKNVLVLQDKNNLFISRFNPRKYPSLFLYSPEKKLLDYEDNEDCVFRIANIINKSKK